MGFGGILGILLIAGIVWAVLRLSDRENAGNLFSSGRNKIPPDTESPMDILKKRYASGEISREGFEGMKKTIS